MHLVRKLKPFSLPEFYHGRALTSERQQHIPPLCLGQLLEKPRLHWSDQPVPHLDTDPWRYGRDPVPSCLWGHVEFSTAWVCSASREGSRGLLGTGAGISREFWQEAQLEALIGR